MNSAQKKAPRTNAPNRLTTLRARAADKNKAVAVNEASRKWERYVDTKEGAELGRAFNELSDLELGPVE